MDDNKQIDTLAQPDPPNARPMIGMLIWEIDHSGLMLRWRGAADATREQGANLFCFIGGRIRAPQGFEGQANVIYDLVDVEQFDGLTIWPANIGSFVSQQELEAFVRRFHPLPMVSSDQTFEGIPSVLMSGYQSMREAILHLIQAHGCRRIAFIRGPASLATAQERYQAYLDTLAECSLPLDPNLVSPPGAWLEWGAPAMRMLIDERGLRPSVDFEAVVGTNSSQAVDAMAVLQARGFQVPGEVAVVGFDDVKETWTVTPPLTTVSAPFYEMGRRSTELLLARLQGEQAPVQTVLPARLVVRQSCGCQSPAVVQAGMPVAATGKPFETFLDQREETLAVMAQALGSPDSKLAREWAAALLDTFIAELTAKSSGVFLPALDETLQQSAALDYDMAAWQEAISALRRQAYPYLGGIFPRAEGLWGQARVMIGEMTRRQQAHKELQAGQQARTLRQIEAALITTFDVERLMDVLAESLPRLGIPSCYLALYENPRPYRYPRPAPEWSRLVLAYTEKGRVQLEPDGQRFPSRQLAPKGMLPQDRQYSMVVMPLYFQENQIGFVLFEAGPHEGVVYRTLCTQISSALQGALLVRRIQERSGELARQQYILDTFMETIPDRIYFKDINGRITRANKAHAIHLKLSDPVEEIGKSDFDFFPEEQARVRYEQEQAIIRTGQPILNVEESDGQDHWTLTTKMPLRDERGQIVGTFGILHDITELKQAQAALQRAYAEAEQQVEERTAQLQQELAERKQVEREREKLITELEARNAELERFTYTVSHDLKAPLITIRGFLGFVEKDALAGNLERLRNDINRIVEVTDKMQRLLTELLELSRIGRMMNPPEAVSFETIVREALELVRGRITQRGVQVEIAPNLPIVYGDRARLVEVVQNLVDNAAKFMGDQPNPRIEIGSSGTNADGKPTFFVRDNGIGIDPKYHEQIFGLFNKLDAQTEGTGVGLALVKRIVEVHGGRIWVESEGLGHGTTVCLTLPTCAGDARVQDSPASGDNP